MDRIDAMTAFITVANEGSFTRAADKLGLSNQLVSKYVSQFEDHLGARLFNRTTRRVHLTEAGEDCYQFTVQILESIDDMEGRFGQMQSEPSGMLRISAPVSFSTLHLAPLIRDFRQLHPSIGIDLQLNDRKIDVIEEGFDLALRIGHLKNSSMVAKPITPIRLVLCAAPEYLAKHGTPTQPDELNTEHFLRYSYMNYNSTPANPLMEVLKPKLNKQEASFSSNNGELLTAAAIAGQGFVLQPTFIVGSALLDGTLVRMLPDYEPEPTALYAIYPHRKLLANKLRVFLDFIGNYYGEQPYWDEFDSE